MSIWRKAGLGVFVLLALAGGLCWIYADRILNELIRPQIEEALNQALGAKVGIEHRSEERRVGKECTSWCRSRWSPYH